MKQRSITITPVLNGFVVSVGCQTVVFQSVEALVFNLAEYYKDPIKTEKRFRHEKINDTIEDVCCEPMQVSRAEINRLDVPPRPFNIANEPPRARSFQEQAAGLADPVPQEQWPDTGGCP